MRRNSVDIWRPGSPANGATSSAMVPGSTSGSSPCTLTTMSQSSVAATSARRSAAGDRAPIERRGAELDHEMKRFHERMQPTAAPRREGRNLFRFHDAPAHASAAAAPRAPVPDLVPAPPPLPPLRLVGLGEE